MKKIAVGDLGEFWYGDYKEPFEQLEGGVPGHPVGALLKDTSGTLLCAFCGGLYDNLGNHSRLKHGLNAKAYKKEVGLLQKSALISEKVRLGQIAVTTRRYMKGEITPLLDQPNYRRGRSGGSARTPEKLNRTGQCYAQVLAVAKSIIREKGVLTSPQLRKHGVENAMYWYFDSVEDLAKAAGGRSKNRRWSKRALVTALRAIAVKIGHTPSESDLNRWGLPSYDSFRRHFGTYAAACRAAGLDPNLPKLMDSDLEARLLLAYATTGTYPKAAEAVGISTWRARPVFDRYGIELFLGGGKWRTSDRDKERAKAAEIARRLVDWPESGDLGAASPA